MKNYINEPLLKLNLCSPAWIHCSICNHCALPDHSCEGPKDGCFICGELDHKRGTCPNISASKKANKLVEFFYLLAKIFSLRGFIQSSPQNYTSYGIQKW